MDLLELHTLERADSLFVAPHGDDVPLSCPARVHTEAERGRRVLVVALFEPEGTDGKAAEAVRRLGASYLGAGLPPARDRRARHAPSSPATERGPEDEDVLIAAASLLAEIGPRVEAVHVHAPLGLGSSVDHDVAYEASVRAFASGAGRNLFLYEERPEAFVPGAVRTRLALLGARLPPAGESAAPRARLLSMLWRVNEPGRLRDDTGGLRGRLATIAAARRRWRTARVWNPLRAWGPRLQPIVHAADEEAQSLAREVAELVLPRDRKGRPRSARRFGVRADRAAKALGAPYHAERLWLFLPAGDGLPEARHPLEGTVD
jgi:LmbE family N-acetylglucosaminyl deacetylase